MIKIKKYNSLPDCALDIRITVFVHEQGFVDEVDEIDKVAIHLVMFDGEDPIATCRIFKDEKSDDYILGRLAVLRDYRGRGCGKMMLREAEKAAREQKACSLRLHSQYHAKEFYEKCGYKICSDIEYEQNSPHVWMTKGLM